MQESGLTMTKLIANYHTNSKTAQTLDTQTLKITQIFKFQIHPIHIIFIFKNLFDRTYTRTQIAHYVTKRQRQMATPTLPVRKEIPQRASNSQIQCCNPPTSQSPQIVLAHETSSTYKHMQKSNKPHEKNYPTINCPMYMQQFEMYMPGQPEARYHLHTRSMI